MVPATQPPDTSPDRRRRWLLGSLALLGVAGVGGVAGFRRLTAHPPPTNELVTAIPDEELRELADRYSPDLHFDRREKWFPTDVMHYSTEESGETIVDGFHALTEYTREYHEQGQPPKPTVYWHAHDAADGVFAIQYWMYSVFDQFTVNFHWHDWELLQVFIDAETREPVLISASAHSRASPNNEFMAPDLVDGRRPIILAELGSHSSGTDLNDNVPSFDRLPDGSISSDVTNDWVSITDRIDTPFAYGLPRDEGARLPMVLPELDGNPLYDHSRLSDVVGPDDFLDEEVTVRGWRDLVRPPTELPLREAGLVMTHPDSVTEGDMTYELRQMGEVEEIIGFTGPQLSFEFPIPIFAENAYADHITSVGIPWEQPRYTDPLRDVTDFQHRLAVQGFEATELLDRVVGQFTLLQRGGDGVVDTMSDAELEALGPLVAISHHPIPAELAVRLASPDPSMVATNDGIFGFLRVTSGEHLLGAIGPGIAPVAVRFVHEGGTMRAGTDGRLSVVANEHAAWIRGDGQKTTGIASLRINEDFAGAVYEGLPVEEDQFAVAVHRDGRYIVDFHDRQGVRGAVRVIPGNRDEIILNDMESGKLSLVRVLSGLLASTVELALDLCEECELVTTHIGPRRTSFENAQQIRAGQRSDTVAIQDQLGIRLETGGMADQTPEAVLESVSVTFHRIEGRGEITHFDTSDPGVQLLAGDTGVYLTIDMAASEVRFAPGQTWEVTLSIPGEAPIEPKRFEIVERRVELAMEEPPYRVTQSEEATVAGRSMMAPGTTLTVQIRTPREIIGNQEVAIDENRRFAATFDLSNRQVGESLEIKITEDDREYILEEGVVAEKPSEDPSSTVSQHEIERGWDVVRPITEATVIIGDLDTASTTEVEVNDKLMEVMELLEKAIDRVLGTNLSGLEEFAARVLSRRLEALIERSSMATETPM